ncbi:MAG: hypothetical protein OXH70_02115 [Acidobacteria bacterium]|nr:hypothetical protein [Acidobacteriota bacterium]MCY3971576.1 hypothetical protein [Acidobacteriota bacterium]
MNAETLLRGVQLTIVVAAVVAFFLAERIRTHKSYKHPIRAGWSTSEEVTSDDFVAQNDRGYFIEIPGPDEPKCCHMLLWRSDVDGGVLDEIYPNNQGSNQRGAYVSSSLTIDGVPGQVMRSGYKLIYGPEDRRFIRVDKPTTSWLFVPKS